MVTGIVVDGVTGEPLPAVIVSNQDNRQTTTTNANGRFTITGAQGHRIHFSSPGFRTQEKTVPASQVPVEMHIDLFTIAYELDEVTVRQVYTQYQLDSINRKETYKAALSRPKSSVMSPASYIADKLSGKSKRLFRFQKSFGFWENQKYIETRYTPELVREMTGLEGDAIAAFINAHPMPVDFARVATDLEIKMWIRNQFRASVADSTIRIPADSTAAGEY